MIDWFIDLLVDWHGWLTDDSHQTRSISFRKLRWSQINAEQEVYVSSNTYINKAMQKGKEKQRMFQKKKSMLISIETTSFAYLKL